MTTPRDPMMHPKAAELVRLYEQGIAQTQARQIVGIRYETAAQIRAAYLVGGRPAQEAPPPARGRRAAVPAPAERRGQVVPSGNVARSLKASVQHAIRRNPQATPAEIARQVRGSNPNATRPRSAFLNDYINDVTRERSRRFAAERPDVQRTTARGPLARRGRQLSWYADVTLQVYFRGALQRTETVELGIESERPLSPEAALARLRERARRLFERQRLVPHYVLGQRRVNREDRYVAASDMRGYRIRVTGVQLKRLFEG